MNGDQFLYILIGLQARSSLHNMGFFSIERMCARNKEVRQLLEGNNGTNLIWIDSNICSKLSVEIMRNAD